jgi:hypothetical protein
MSLRHNLLYKTWADRSGVCIDTLHLKCKRTKNERKTKTKMFIKTQNVHMYKLLDTNNGCDLYDRPVLSTGRTPHNKQNRNCFDCNQNLVTWSWVPDGLNAKTGCLTDDFRWRLVATILSNSNALLEVFRYIEYNRNTYFVWFWRP